MTRRASGPLGLAWEGLFRVDGGWRRTPLSDRLRCTDRVPQPTSELVMTAGARSPREGC